MRTWHVVTFMLAMFTGMIYLQFRQETKNNIRVNIDDRIVKIISVYPFGESQGTGTKIGKNRILTNSHLFVPSMAPEQILAIGPRDSDFYPLVIISSNTATDFAILKFKGEDDTDFLPITTEWKYGESIFLEGNPMNKDFLKGTSHIIGLTYLSNPMGWSRPILIFKCGVGQPGFSGGGIWNQKGQYLGIFEMYSPLLGICMAIPSKEVLKAGVLEVGK
jgi:S1-C subfamily serine protease